MGGVAGTGEPAAAARHSGDGFGGGGQDRGYGVFGDDQRRGRLGGQRQVPGATHLPARAATEALEQDLAASPDLSRVRAVLTGRPRAPRLTLTVTLSASADPAAARSRIDQAILRLRQSLDTEELPAVLHLRITAMRT